MVDLEESHYLKQKKCSHWGRWWWWGCRYGGGGHMIIRDTVKSREYVPWKHAKVLHPICRGSPC